MANYCGTARSNYFEVKNMELFEAAMAEFELSVHGNSELPDHVCILFENEAGDIPCGKWSDSMEDYVEVDFPALVAEHLADGSVAVFMEAGAEKMRYIIGHAIAINNKGDIRRIMLSDIYDLAKELGENVTAAEY